MRFETVPQLQPSRWYEVLTCGVPLLLLGVSYRVFHVLGRIDHFYPVTYYYLKSKTIALGTVFSTLMMAICAGSSLFKIFTEGLPKRFTLSPNACLIVATG